MIITQSIAPPNQLLADDTIRQTLAAGLAGRHTRQKVLVLIPDRTRTIPLPQLFRYLVEILRDVRQLDFMVALGTHPPLSEAQLYELVGITAEERQTTYRHVGLFNHAWDRPDTLTQIGVLPQAQVQAIAGQTWHPSLGGDVPVNINRAALAYDHILILGPTFPHEVAGFSGGAKYLFPGISGPEMINTTHWLGALVGVVGTIGVKDTAVRAMIHAAAELVPTPISLIALVVVGQGLAGMFIGDYLSAWNAAAELSAERHIIWVDRPFRRVLSCAPPMYDELWTAGKAMYKLEPALAEGGELIIYAPHLSVVSHVHGQYIYEIGYHVLPYFLNQWDKFKHIPLGVLAHSTHVRGGGRFVDGIEYPRAQVTLATQLSPEDCAQLALGYLNPNEINVAGWQNREDEGILFVPKAGEMLYRVKKV
ncbi:MAG: lactate racemase domain-containing protein [Chloroflexi bacterium]|nr:lactate racemase domain-containing protein [Chloroflexota bacterium]MCI0578412.1 lactate racemase domain-containing protein [Chloroflexota bacterium]MCI0648152.1 lactate racemase domain-containing protein [Chloroflexota bacterium]MCI0726667.1 lactate racemase domain-containing protein [Chloroflexota bacterium]